MRHEWRLMLPIATALFRLQSKKPRAKAASEEDKVQSVRWRESLSRPKFLIQDGNAVTHQASCP
jgi:hypothetical protein